MIGIEGQFLLDLKTEVGDSLFKFGEVLSFSCIEDTSIHLPIFNFTFVLNDLSQAAFLNSGSQLQLGLSKERKDLKYIVIKVLQVSEISIQDSKAFNIAATLYVPEYDSFQRTRVFSQKTSISILKEVLSSYFEVESNISLTNDRKNWIQSGISDKLFMEHVWFNSYLDSGFLALGCPALEDIYVVKDIVKLFSQSSYDYKAVEEGEYDSDDFLITSVSTSAANYSFFDVDLAKPKQTLSYNPLTETFLEKEITIDTLLSTADKISRNAKSGTGYERLKINTNNNHFKSKNYNLLALSNYSKVNLILSSLGQFHPVKLLDKVYVNLKPSRDSGEFWSGNYIVRKVVRSMENSKFSTKVVLTRESHGQNKGSDI